LINAQALLIQAGKEEHGNNQGGLVKSAKNLNNTALSNYGAGAGVSEPGLNRWPDYDCLRHGGGLKILWRRPSWVQVPPPALPRL